MDTRERLRMRLVSEIKALIVAAKKIDEKTVLVDNDMVDVLIAKLEAQWLAR